MRKIRIFISSPGDVQIERNIARNVISELNTLYAKYTTIETLMWEDFPLSADSTFQDGINYFITDKPIDIAVFILWSRLGTPLCKKFRKEDGSPYKSGTEYEFDLMMKSHNENNHPSRILTYVKNCKKVTQDISDISDLEEFLNQKKAVEGFLTEYFRDEETNSNYAYLSFGENISFEQIFRKHIINAIRDIIGEIADIKEWKGNPYVGLNSFEYGQQAIFFGRKQLIYETATRLTEFNDNYNSKKSLIVLGESGSGKSSFVKAGLLPFFCNRNNSPCEHVIISPSMFNGHMYQGLIDLLVKHIDYLDGHPFINELRSGISENTNFSYLSYVLEKEGKTDLIIYIDQFEELFCNNTITEEERKRVLLLLRGLVEMRRITMFISMRSDFYNRFFLYESMSQIKEKCEVLDIPAMGVVEIAEIIEEPARKACLKWEIDNNGHSLHERIIKDATLIKDLPLIEFALSELYERRNEKGELTEKAYKEMGGMRGAIINYADRCYEQLNEEEKQAFNDILSFIITESSSQKGVYVRKTSLREDAEKTNLHKNIIGKMLESRLFVSGKDCNGKATITITHEMLLKHWSIVSEWIEKEKEFISSNNHYEQMALHWLNNGKKKQDLIQGRSSMLEAEYYQFRNENRISNKVLDFLNSSVKAEKRKGLVWRIILCASLILSYIITALYIILDIKIGTELFDNITCSDFILYSGGVLILLCHSIYLRVKARPKYKTIKQSIAVRSVSTLFLFLFVINNQTNLESVFYTILFSPFIPVLLYLVDTLWEFRRRIKWKKGFVPYTISDGFRSQFVAITITAIILIFMMCIGGVYGIDLAEKNEKLENLHFEVKQKNEKLMELANVTDRLFYDFDNIKGRLSHIENKYVNELRYEYLRDNFKEEINDDIDDIRDIELASVYYNLREPQEALQILYPDNNLTHHLFWIICAYEAGYYEESSAKLESYVEKEYGYYRFNDIFNTENLVWISEKLGRFDLAEELDNIIADTLPHYSTNYIASINRGHIHLYFGNINEALECYESAIKDATALGYVDDSKKCRAYNNIKNDFLIFSRYEIIPDELLKNVAYGIGVDFKPAYVTLSNVHPEIYEKLEGKWLCEEEKIILEINSYTKSFKYKFYDEDLNETDNVLYEGLIGKIGEGLYLDELERSKDINSIGKIIELTDEYFCLKIIDNGNTKDKGKQRKYQRIKSE